MWNNAQLNHTGQGYIGTFRKWTGRIYYYFIQVVPCCGGETGLGVGSETKGPELGL